MSSSSITVARDALPRDVVHRILADSRRRVVLEVLAVREPPIEVVNLARAVVAREQETIPPVVSADDVRETAISLYHTHLPTLDEHDAIEFDSMNNTVELAGNFDDVAAALDEACP